MACCTDYQLNQLWAMVYHFILYDFILHDFILHIHRAMYKLL